MAFNKRVASVVAGAVIAIAGTAATTFEGNVPTTYHDIGGTATACYGHTGSDVKAGVTYTQDQCAQWLHDDLLKAALGVQSCVTAPMSITQEAAYTDFAYNEGVGTFCRSSVARLANAGDRKGSCAALGLYVYAAGQKLLGLIRRRAFEQNLCVTLP